MVIILDDELKTEIEEEHKVWQAERNELIEWEWKRKIQDLINKKEVNE